MPFVEFDATGLPARYWELVAAPEAGKSTFAAQMRGPLVIVDSDHRWIEQARRGWGVQSFALSKDPLDNIEADRIAERLMENMPGTRVGTIVVDSVTAIITPLVVKAMRDYQRGVIKNQAAGFSGKALAMRTLQDSVTRWGTDTLWIYHEYAARDAKAREIMRASVSETELARLHRCVNLRLQIVLDTDGKRGIRVVWCRYGREGMTLWDDSGQWAGMPERIEHECYEGLSAEEMKQNEERIPRAFKSPDLALAWAMEQGVFKSIAHARNAYDKIKREQQPANAVEMTTLWVSNVRERKTQPGLFESEGE